MNTNEVVIVMPVHGEAPFLGAAVRSILQQTYSTWKLEIVLDRPAPQTQALVEQYAAEDRRISCRESLLPGISAALNTGINNSCSEFIGRLDADDVMAPSRLELQLAEMRKEKDLLVLGTQVLYIDAKGSGAGASSFPISNKEIQFCLPRFNVIAHPSTLIRRAAVEQVGGYRETHDGVEDYDLWLRLSGLGEIRNHPLILTAYRRHPGQVTNNRRGFINVLAADLRLEFFGSHVDDLPSQRASHLVQGEDPLAREPVREISQPSISTFDYRIWSALQKIKVTRPQVRKHILERLLTKSPGSLLRILWIIGKNRVWGLFCRWFRPAGFGKSEFKTLTTQSGSFEPINSRAENLGSE